jgi:hypothetical protein
MPPHFRVGALLGALVVVVLSSCVDSNVAAPDVPIEAGASYAILDGSTTGSGDFYFLPPIVSGSPTIIGEFNPFLLPAVRVCELDMLLGSCVAAPPVASFPAGSITPSGGKYGLSWDTDGPETGPLNTSRYYRLEVLVGEVVVGWIELDPQDPDGPGQSSADAYAFRVGETVPVQFWLSTRVLCEIAAYVTECITRAVVDESGANLSLENAGNKLGVVIYEGGLPGPNADPIAVTLERIDPALFLAATGEECIPLFDAPQFADCFRITTSPELTDPLDLPALVSICMDPLALSGIDLSVEQQNQLTMVRFNNQEWEALPDAPGDCPIPTASLLPVPDEGLLRYAALGVNAVARFVGPRPLAARDIRFGGFVSSFSRFRYALPGQMLAVAGDGTVLQPADPADVLATVRVVDHEGVPVENARVHFATGDGSVSASEVTTDVDGYATTTWTVDKSMAGAKTLTASALGLVAGAVPDHAAPYFFTTESIELTATVVGGPTPCLDGFGTASVDGAFDAAEWACAESLPFTASISGGSTAAEVHWMNDGSNLYLAVRVRQSSLDKVNSLRFDFDNDGDGVTEVGDDVIGYDFGSRTFLDQSLNQQCVNRNQAGCSVGGEPVDGSGAIGNDGTWTVYELAHPLDGADPADFSLAAGDPVGFFLTLRIGGGAQGNTQFPGFRKYAVITIAGS